MISNATFIELNPPDDSDIKSILSFSYLDKIKKFASSVFGLAFLGTLLFAFVAFGLFDINHNNPINWLFIAPIFIIMDLASTWIRSWGVSWRLECIHQSKSHCTFETIYFVQVRDRIGRKRVFVHDVLWKEVEQTSLYDYKLELWLNDVIASIHKKL